MRYLTLPMFALNLAVVAYAQNTPLPQFDVVSIRETVDGVRVMGELVREPCTP